MPHSSSCRRPLLSLPIAAARLLGTLLALWTPAAALAQPLGWQAVAPGQWADPAQHCTYRAEQRGQVFPVLRSHGAATALAGRLRQSLARQGVRDVTVRPVGRGQVWALYAQYIYPSAEGDVQVAQLYASAGGLLRTVTGSTRVSTVSALPPSAPAPAPAAGGGCWPELSRFIEFGAQ